MSGARRTAIVTGASRGIGRATAIRLARDFDNVAVIARSPDGLDSTADAARALGAKALPLPMDLREPAAAEVVVTRVLDRFGRIDALINVAGAVPQTDLFAMGDEEWSDGFSLKFHGARRLTLRAWDALRRASGSVVFLSGSSAITPKASLAAVGTINAAISALAKAFAERGTVEGVQVNSILPGPVMTDRRRSMLEKYAAAHRLGYEEAVVRYASETGIERYGTPEDIAALIAFVVSPPARWMTGASLRMDGGEIRAV